MINIKNSIAKISKKTFFQKAVIIYFSVLILMTTIFLIYIRNSLLLYEHNQPNIYIEYVLNKLAKGKAVTKYIDYTKEQVSQLETRDVKVNDGYKNILNNTQITYKIKDEDDKTITYIVLSEGRAIMDINIKKGKELNRIGLLTFNKLALESIKIDPNKGLYYYDIVIPSTFNLKVNGHLLTKEYMVFSEPSIEFGNDTYGVLANQVTYKVTNLLYKPEIIITNNKEEEVAYEEKDSTITVTSSETVANEKTALTKLVKPIDVLAFAKMWSLFLTKDLAGGTKGFKTLEKYFIKNSYMWDRAYAWATGIDINWVSAHTLKSPPFTNEKLSNFKIYNDKAFSCEVYLEKNMLVGVARKSKVDIMNDILYFIYYDDTNDGIDNPAWKLINMKAVTTE